MFRGLVCFQIVVAHCYIGGMFSALDEYFGPTVTWAVGNLRFGYESFFVVAGYFLAHSFRSAGGGFLSLPAFLRRRLVRIAIPYWVALAIGILGAQLIGALRHREYPFPGVGELVSLLLFVHDLAGTKLLSISHWFMAPLLQFYLLWGCAFWAVRRWYLRRQDLGYHNHTVRVMIGLTGAVMIVSLGCVAADFHPRWRLADNAVFLALGCFVFWQTAGRRVNWPLGLTVAAVAAVGMIEGGSRLIAAVVTTLVLPRIAAGPAPPNWMVLRPLLIIGRWSYSIYLIHTFVTYRVLNLPDVLGLPVTPGVAIATTAVAVVAGIGSGAILYRLVERPIAALAREVRYRGSEPSPGGA